MRTRHLRAWHYLFAISALVGMSGGCIAIYTFDDFENDAPPKCTTKEQCPGSDACGDRSCVQGYCTIENSKPAGTLVSNLDRGDCLRRVCDGNGAETTVPEDTDLPVDGDNCTLDLCTNGTPSHAPAESGTACGIAPQVRCNEAGACAGCFADSDCGMDTKCAHWTCENSICVKNIELLGTVVDDPQMGDCRRVICNAAGEAVESIVEDDAPSDGNECTSDICNAEGQADHPPSNVDTLCGTCGMCAAGGICAACDTGLYDCPDGKCIPKPIECTSGAECPSTYCVDGYCCDQECSGQCMGCSQAKTGEPSGLCKPITNDTDPDNECNSGASDVCLNGVCRCSDGLQNGTETGTDCGMGCMACTGAWQCGDGTCSGSVTPECCAAIGALCVDCSDKTATCTSIQGTTCVVGTPSQTVTFGTVIQSNCPVFALACRYVTCVCK